MSRIKVNLTLLDNLNDVFKTVAGKPNKDGYIAGILGSEIQFKSAMAKLDNKVKSNTYNLKGQTISQRAQNLVSRLTKCRKALESYEEYLEDVKKRYYKVQAKYKTLDLTGNSVPYSYFDFANLPGQEHPFINKIEFALGKNKAILKINEEYRDKDYGPIPSIMALVKSILMLAEEGFQNGFTGASNIFSSLADALTLLKDSGLNIPYEIDDALDVISEILGCMAEGDISSALQKSDDLWDSLGDLIEALYEKVNNIELPAAKIAPILAILNMVAHLIGDIVEFSEDGIDSSELGQLLLETGLAGGNSLLMFYSKSLIKYDVGNLSDYILEETQNFNNMMEINNYPMALKIFLSILYSPFATLAGVGYMVADDIVEFKEFLDGIFQTK